MTMTTLAPPTMPQRTLHLVLNLLVFSLCYTFTNFIAQQAQVTRHLAFAFEVHLPFLAWMSVPYFCASAIFIWAFFRVRSGNALRMLSQQTLLTTVMAAWIFLLYPLQFSWDKPALAAGSSALLFAPLFDILRIVDKPYNQLPSLHVANCLIAWVNLKSAFTQPLAQLALAVFLTLIAVSTLFTFQHHSLDIVGGVLAGGLAIFLVPRARIGPQVAFYYAMAAAIFALLALGLARNPFAIFFAYLGLSFTLVSVAYARRQRNFLNKTQGRHALLIWALYAPYLIGYRLTWYAVRWRERRHPAFKKITEQLWIGRRLTTCEALALSEQALPKQCTVIDLSPELPETASLRQHRYWHFPLLDLVAPSTAHMDQVADLVRDELQQGHAVYLHCAMGYSRCTLLLAHYQQLGHAIPN